MSFLGATPARRVGSFRGYPLVTILLAAVKARPTLDRVTQTGANGTGRPENWITRVQRVPQEEWRMASGRWRMTEAKWRMTSTE